MKTILAIIAALLLISLAGATITDYKITVPVNGDVFEAGTSIYVHQSTTGDGSTINSTLLVDGIPTKLLRPTKIGVHILQGSAIDKDGTVLSNPVSIKIITGIEIDTSRIPKTAKVGAITKISAMISLPGTSTVSVQQFVDGVPASSRYVFTTAGTHQIKTVVTDGWLNTETATTSIVVT